MAKTAENIAQVTDEGWETVVEPYADTFPFEVEGAYLIGVYISKRTITQEGLDGNDREVNIYEVADNDGKRWSVWGSYNIDAAFESIHAGQPVKITYEGIANLEAGRTVKKFTVQSK